MEKKIYYVTWDWYYPKYKNWYTNSEMIESKPIAYMLYWFWKFVARSPRVNITKMNNFTL